jgi:putative FmdB family regulatory protein
MPTYEYECGACGHRFEKFQSITAKPIRKCPECGKSQAKRLLGTGAALLFKGSGFYATDYRSSSYKEAAKSETKSGDAGKDTSKSGDAKSGSEKSSGGKAGGES